MSAPEEELPPRISLCRVSPSLAAVSPTVLYLLALYLHQCCIIELLCHILLCCISYSAVFSYAAYPILLYFLLSYIALFLFLALKT